MPDPRHDELVRYFMERTDGRLSAIDEKLSSLAEFKIQMLVSSRWVSLIISVICGLVSLAVSTGVAIYIAKQESPLRYPPPPAAPSISGSRLALPPPKPSMEKTL